MYSKYVKQYVLKESKLDLFVIDDEPLFVAKDIVENLGYNLSGKHVASEYVKAHCDDDDYVFVDKNSPNEFGSVINYKELGQRGGYLINESGLYALVFGSEIPSAKRFKRWITKEVIPQIRKTGGYITIKQEDTNETIMAKAYLIATETLAKQKELVNKLQPLADAAETRIEKKGCLSLTDVTKSLGFKRGQIIRWAKVNLIFKGMGVRLYLLPWAGENILCLCCYKCRKDRRGVVMVY